VLYENRYEVAHRSGQLRVRYPNGGLDHLDADVRKTLVQALLNLPQGPGLRLAIHPIMVTPQPPADNVYIHSPTHKGATPSTSDQPPGEQ